MGDDPTRTRYSTFQPVWMGAWAGSNSLNGQQRSGQVINWYKLYS
jgi:hypothetical protein